MRFSFGRRSDRDGIDESSWADRLEAAGRAIDAYGAPLRDVAIVSSGGHIIVSALAWQSGTLHSGWIPVTFFAGNGKAMPFAPPAPGESVS